MDEAGESRGVGVVNGGSIGDFKLPVAVQVPIVTQARTRTINREIELVANSASVGGCRQRHGGTINDSVGDRDAVIKLGDATAGKFSQVGIVPANKPARRNNVEVDRINFQAALDDLS